MRLIKLMGLGLGRSQNSPWFLFWWHTYMFINPWSTIEDFGICKICEGTYITKPEFTNHRPQWECNTLICGECGCDRSVLNSYVDWLLSTNLFASKIARPHQAKHIIGWLTPFRFSGRKAWLPMYPEFRLSSVMTPNKLKLECATRNVDLVFFSQHTQNAP